MPTWTSGNGSLCFEGEARRGVLVVMDVSGKKLGLQYRLWDSRVYRLHLKWIYIDLVLLSSRTVSAFILFVSCLVHCVVFRSSARVSCAGNGIQVVLYIGYLLSLGQRVQAVGPPCILFQAPEPLPGPSPVSICPAPELFSQLTKSLLQIRQMSNGSRTPAPLPRPLGNGDGAPVGNPP